MFNEPLAGFRQETARPQRTKTDWAQEVAQLLDTRYADCQQVTLVLDNLNTHTMLPRTSIVPKARSLEKKA